MVCKLVDLNIEGKTVFALRISSRVSIFWFVLRIILTLMNELIIIYNKFNDRIKYDNIAVNELNFTFFR